MLLLKISSDYPSCETIPNIAYTFTDIIICWCLLTEGKQTIIYRSSTPTVDDLTPLSTVCSILCTNPVLEWF